MISPEELNSRFPNDSIDFETGVGELTRCRISNEQAEAEIYLHGAHVTHFQPKGLEPVLWMSSEAVFHPAKAIRGGIPICWPWFGQNAEQPDFPQHGFARINEWNVRAVLESDEATDILLGLTPHEGTREYLDGSYDARYRISIGESLTVEMSVTNTGEHDLVEIGCALHTYFSVSAIENIHIDGLVGHEFLDQLTGSRSTETDLIRFREEFDRVYFGSPEKITLQDGKERSLSITSNGSKSTVIWNPWVDKSQRMGDFPDDGFQKMVCIESANAYDDTRTIGPGETHSVSQTITPIR